MSENNRNEIKIREANLKELKKKLHEAKLNQMRQKKLRDERKRKFEALDEPTRKKVPGKATSDLTSELIEAICRIAVSGSAAHEPRRNEVIRIVKTLSVTIDEKLEMKNFEHAGRLLAKI